MIVLNSLRKFRESVQLIYGFKTAIWHLVITSCQFHLMFYASRPLPNIFALSFTMYAMAYRLRGFHGRFVMTSAFTILIFRGELALLLGLFLFMDIVFGGVKILPTIGEIIQNVETAS